MPGLSTILMLCGVSKRLFLIYTRVCFDWTNVLLGPALSLSSIYKRGGVLFALIIAMFYHLFLTYFTTTITSNTITSMCMHYSNNPSLCTLLCLSIDLLTISILKILSYLTIHTFRSACTTRAGKVSLFGVRVVGGWRTEDLYGFDSFRFV